MIRINSDERDAKGYKVCDEQTQYATFFVRPLTNVKVQELIQIEQKDKQKSFEDEVDYVVQGWTDGDVGDETGFALTVSRENKVALANKQRKLYNYLVTKSLDYQKLIEDALEQEKKDLGI